MNIEIDPDFWENVEKKSDQVLYGDTDSIFLGIKKIKPKNTEEAIKEAKELTGELNNLIVKYKNEVVLPKLNIDQSYNKTDFKNEFTASQIMFLEVKKNYAYKKTSNEGKILETPKIEYTGIPIVRTDASKYTQDMIRSIIEDVALSDEKNKIKKLKEVFKYFHNIVDEHVKDYNFDYIGIPCKWADRQYKLESADLVSMRLYNTIVNDEIFKPPVSGLRLPIKIKNMMIFNSHIDPLRGKKQYYLNDEKLENFNFLSVPYNYDKENLKKTLENFEIEIDTETFKEKLFIKIAQRITEIIKENYAY